MPSEDPELTKQVNDIGNPWNRWQENFRAGWLDIPLLEYASTVVGKIDYLAVSCLDHMRKIKVCEKRSKWEQEIELPHYRMATMEANTRALKQAANSDSSRELEEVTFDELMEILTKIAPLGIIADGPTWEHRVSRWEKK